MAIPTWSRTAGEVEELARKTLGLDETPEEPTPAFYLPLFRRHLEKCPHDTNFIVELAEPGVKGSTLGGNGFGTITCMEDHCWRDIVLSADPTRLEGGKGDGFGSFSDYQGISDQPSSTPSSSRFSSSTSSTSSTSFPNFPSFTTTPHSSSASSSSSKTSRPFDKIQSAHSRSSLSSDPSSSRSFQNTSTSGPSRRSILDELESDADDQGPFPPSTVKTERVSLPSRHRASSPLRPSTSLHKTGSVFSSSPPPARMRKPIPLKSERADNAPSPMYLRDDGDAKPKITSSQPSQFSNGTSRLDAISISSSSSPPGSDDDVLALNEDDIPEEYRKVTNKDNPIPLSDESDDDLGSQWSKGKQAASSQNSSSSRKPIAPLFNRVKKEADRSRSRSQREREQREDSLEARERRFDDIFGPKPADNRSMTSSSMPPSIQLPVPPASQQAAKVSVNDLVKLMPDDRAEAFPGVDVVLTTPEARLAIYSYEDRLLRSIQPPYAYDREITALIRGRMKDITIYKIRPHMPWVAPTPLLLRRVPLIKTAIQSYLKTRLQAAQPAADRAGQNAVAGPSNLYAHPAVGWGGTRSADVSAIVGGHVDGPYAMPGAYSGPGAMVPINPSNPLDPLNPLNREVKAEDIDNGFGYEWDRPTTNEGLTTFFDENLKDFLEDTTVDDGLQKLNLESLTDHLPGLRIQLMPHQVLGVSFMLEKEQDKKYKGGINGDSMGLGKTVQSIALLAVNPSQDRKVKTTLVVAPLALLSQWKAEIESKTTQGLLKVVIHHGPKRTRSPNALKTYDVVLTTYGTLVSDFGTEDKHKPTVKVDDKDASDEEEFRITKKQGPLMKVHWYRVILDEAHQIRNKNTRAAKACFALNAHFRWCLTGTLIVNSLDDVYPYLHFLMVSPSRNWEHFRDSISRVQRRRPNLATKRVQAILRTCCIRRHKESTLNGKKLLELPPKTTEVITLDFTDEERQIYLAIENKFQVKFNTFLKKGTVMKHYSIMLVMLMRLRQLTCHPWLLRRNPGEKYDERDVLVTDEDLLSGVEGVKEDNISERARAITLIGQEVVERISRILTERRTKLDEDALRVKRDPDLVKDGECSICMDAFDDNTERVTPCCHSFCSTCLEDIFNTESRDPDINEVDLQAGRRKCPMCRSMIDKKMIFRAAAFLPEEDEVSDDEAEEASEAEAEEDQLASDEGDLNASDRKGKRKATASQAPPAKKRTKTGEDKVPNPLADMEDDLAMENVLPSTKMQKLGDIIEQVYNQDPSQKIIVFSQFVQYIDLCALFLERREIPHVTYVGYMKQGEREEAIAHFNKPADEPGSPRVILMSLKCGGVGLNLCAANHVICLDLAWNAATENQAVDRAHRIGQTKEVTVHRVVIANTVEQRIMALQESKQALSDGAMGEGAGGRIGRLSVQDLIKLFGVGGEDD